MILRDKHKQLNDERQ